MGNLMVLGTIIKRFTWANEKRKNFSTQPTKMLEIDLLFEEIEPHVGRNFFVSWGNIEKYFRIKLFPNVIVFRYFSKFFAC